MRTGPKIAPGWEAPLGPVPTGEGVHFSVTSAHATRMELCLFDPEGQETRADLQPGPGHVWSGHALGIRPGQRYGFRAHGPYQPEAGHRFNPAKLLLDPYARAVEGPMIWSEALTGDAGGFADPRDSAAVAPRGIVTPILPDYDGARPHTPWSETVIYEAHVKGLTAARPDLAAPGTLSALADPAMLEHLRTLGVTAIELLPVHAFLTDGFLVARNLTNYWGYQTLNFFAPHPAYLAGQGPEAFRETVRAFHAAGIEVILDVVYNHTCEADAGGPTLSFRGLDNARYYRLLPGGAYDNVTGTGNALDCDSPPVQRLILDSLRYWVTKMGVDGFRFDLGATLGRTATGFSARAGLFDALCQDPVLRRVKLIAEPWDIGPGGYRLGGFPHPFAEWNDRFRDTARQFWRGDDGVAPALADALTGSAGIFDRAGRPATASVNFVTAHDGFTLADLTAYAERQNAANGEDGRDGHAANYSQALGGAGPQADPATRALRRRRMINLLATLLTAQGTPMLLAGDELGNSQGGNNNTYAQDNPTGWVDWAADPDLRETVAALTALRRTLPVLRQTAFLHGKHDANGQPDLTWWHEAGRAMQSADWEVPDLRHLILHLRRAATAPPSAAPMTPVLLILNAGPTLTARLPPGAWSIAFSSADEPHGPVDTPCTLPAASTTLLLQKR
ncbi:MAG: glycogen debranching protein GlgX [Pseudomonadota bacterium]